MKKITITVEIPDWALWMAQDENGSWWLYSEKPSPKGGEWEMTTRGVTAMLVVGFSPSSDWGKTLKNI